MQYKINPKFKNLVPNMSKDEFNQLEKNILDEGEVRDPIIIWNDMIVDGHHRYEIIQNHPGIQYDTMEMDFENEDEAILWICSNQLGRRNLDTQDRRYLIGKQVEAQKRLNAGRPEEKLNAESEGEKRQSTATKQVAKQNKVSVATARRDLEYATAIDHLEGLEPGFREMVNDGAIKLTDSFLQKIMETPYDTQKEILQCMIKDECEKAQEILDKALNKDSGSEEAAVKDEEPAAPADNEETAEAEDEATAERTAEEDALDDELDELVYGLDDLQKALRRASDDYLDAINDLLFISQYNLITTEKGNKLAATELKAHVQSVRDALGIVNDTPTAP